MAQAHPHSRTRMGGRDPHQAHRTATPLDFLFNLTFVVAFGIAADKLAHFLTEGHVPAGLVGFGFATFAISWAWIQFSWFASAYDTDDWIFRLSTMVQMVGVLIAALGFPDMFASIDHGDTVDNTVMVAGYLVMRVPMVFQWLRAARQDPGRRSACLTYAVAILVAQAGWVALLIAQTSVLVTFVWVVVLVLVELAGPVIAETRKGGTPWHAHHIAKQYRLLIIITLGEVILGTTVALKAVIAGPGWSMDVVVLGGAGTAVTFGMWWIYFVLPCADVLHEHRERGFGWGYGHIVVFGAVAAVGAGLHAAAYYIEHRSVLAATGTVLTVAVPLAGLHRLHLRRVQPLTRSFDPFHVLLIALSAVIVGGSVLMAVAGVPLVWCLLVLSTAPWVTVVGYETIGHRHSEQVLARARGAVGAR